MEKDVIQMFETGLDLEKSNGLQNDNIASMYNDIANMTNIMELAKHTESGTIVCNNLGEPDLQRTVPHTFKRPFEDNYRVPMIILYASRVEGQPGHDTWYRVKVQDVTLTGFKVECSTTKNSYLKRLIFNFLAIPNTLPKIEI